MKRFLFFLIVFLSIFCGHDIRAQIITTFAGTGGSGNTGDNGPASAAAIDYPTGLVFDRSGNLYVSTGLGNTIRKITPSGIISTIAGTGVAGYNGDNIPATDAQLKSAQGLTVDISGNVYFSDAYNHRARKINAETGIITTFAGTGVGGYNGDNIPATAAQLNNPVGICIDPSGNIYISDYSNARIRKVATSGMITTFAGTGAGANTGDGGRADTAHIFAPEGVCADNLGNIYIACGSKIRKVNIAGIISTYAGDGTCCDGGDGGIATAAQTQPRMLFMDALQNMYISEHSSIRRVRVIDPSGTIHAFAGNGSLGSSGDSGTATAATLGQTWGLAVDTCGNVYIACIDGRRIRKVWVNPYCWTLGAEDVKTEDNEAIYPHPVHDVLHIATGISYTLCDMTGRQVAAGELQQHEINIGNQPAGMYLLQVKHNNGRSTMHKIVKE